METPNWPHLIEEIGSNGGMSYRDIAKAVDSSLGSIWALANGDSKDPAYTRGAQLLDLHKRVMRRVNRKPVGRTP